MIKNKYKREYFSIFEKTMWKKNIFEFRILSLTKMKIHMAFIYFFRVEYSKFARINQNKSLSLSIYMRVEWFNVLKFLFRIVRAYMHDDDGDDDGDPELLIL